jgi:hypothetical protein
MPVIQPQRRQKAPVMGREKFVTKQTNPVALNIIQKKVQMRIVAGNATITPATALLSLL